MHPEREIEEKALPGNRFEICAAGLFAPVGSD